MVVFSKERAKCTWFVLGLRKIGHECDANVNHVNLSFHANVRHSESGVARISMNLCQPSVVSSISSQKITIFYCYLFSQIAPGSDRVFSVMSRLPCMKLKSIEVKFELDI